MKAQDLMTQPVATCHVNDPLSVAAMMMWNHDCGAIAVVRDDGKLAGMITDRDICMAAYTQGLRLEEILVNVAMARHVVSARPDQDITEIERLMAEHKVRRIPVIDADHKPIGVISLHDLATERARSGAGPKNGAAAVGQLLAAICAPRSSAPGTGVG